MASAQVVETSVTNNSPSQDSNHRNDLFQSRYVTPGFKPFSYIQDLILNLHEKMPNGREITRFLIDLTYIDTSSELTNIFSCTSAKSRHLHFGRLRAISLTSNIVKLPATFRHFR